MKDQYFGDINDYRKYGLLRTLGRSSGLLIGVCWLLTRDDGGGDDGLRNYLAKPSRWQHFDPELYDKLRCLSEARIRPMVRHARQWELIPGVNLLRGFRQRQPIRTGGVSRCGADGAPRMRPYLL